MDAINHCWDIFGAVNWNTADTDNGGEIAIVAIESLLFVFSAAAAVLHFKASG